MKFQVFVLMAVLSSAVTASNPPNDFLKPGASEHTRLETVVSDDGALRMSVLPEPEGRAAAIVIVEQVSGETFVFPLDSSSQSPDKNKRGNLAGLQNESGGDSGGGVPDDASLEFMGCSGSVCSYGVYVDDQFIGTLVVDYSGPQPKATLVPPQ